MECDEDETRQEEIEEIVDGQFNERLSFSIDLNADVNSYIKSSIDKLVTAKVNASVEKAVNTLIKEKFEKAINKEITEIVKLGMSTSIKKYDYRGEVTESKSFEDSIREMSKGMAEQGTQYKLSWPTGTGYSRSTKTGTISDLISEHVLLIVGDHLKPQFKIIEDDFKEKSQAALRQFAIAAVDQATAKTLGRING